MLLRIPSKALDNARLMLARDRNRPRQGSYRVPRLGLGEHFLGFLGSHAAIAEGRVLAARL